MSDKQESPIKEGEMTSGDEEIETEFQEYQADSNYQDNDLDLAEDYLNKLKIQRKRIEQLSLLHSTNQENLRKEVQRNKLLRQQIEKLSSIKDYQGKYSELAGNIDILTTENTKLKDQIQDLKTELFTSSNERSQIIQRLRTQLNLQRDKQTNKIENLEEALSAKQDEIEKIQRNAKVRERELMDTMAGIKNTITKLKDEHDTALKVEQRKSDKLEREMITRTMSITETQSNIDSLLKENSQLKEEIFRLTSVLGNRELELKTQAEKIKMKMAGLKKQVKSKEKQCLEHKQYARKVQDERKNNSQEIEDLKSQIKKLKDSTQTITRRLQTDFCFERQSLKESIGQHLQTIQDLVNMKNDLMAQNKRLQAILRKKEAVQKQRRQLLRTELKQIDKLEKVIDRITE